MPRPPEQSDALTAALPRFVYSDLIDDGEPRHGAAAVARKQTGLCALIEPTCSDNNKISVGTPEYIKV